MIKEWVLRLLAVLFQVKIVSDKKERKIFNKEWHKVWLQEGYAEENEPIIQKYEKYDQFSIDLLVRFLGIVPAGTMRIIRNNKEFGLPTLSDFEVKKIWRTEKIAEITLLTVPKKFRQKKFLGPFFVSLSFMVLMKALYQHTREQDFEGLLIAADKRLFYSLTKRIKLPFVKIGEEKYYEGSLTIPGFMTMDDFEGVFFRNNPQLAKFVFW